MCSTARWDRRETLPRRPEHSDVEDYGSSNGSEGSFTRDAPVESFNEAIGEYPRQVTYLPQPTVGFGTSRKGPRPEDLVVARTGSAAGQPPLYRADREPLYRWDSRRPAVIFSEGFQPKSDAAPSSLQYHQMQRTDSAMVSFTRKEEPEHGTLHREAGTDNAYRYVAPSVPGGIDVAMSLGTASYAHQQEVVHWKGMTPDHIARVDAYDVNSELVAAVDNPYASAETWQAQARLDQQTAQDRVYAAACGAEVGQASQYDRYCHQYAEWHVASGGQHSEQGQIDGHVRTYAEFWRQNYYQPEIQQHAQHWAGELGEPWSYANPPQPPAATQALYNDYYVLQDQAAQWAAQQPVATAAQTYAPQNLVNYPSPGAAQQGGGQSFGNVQYTQYGPVQHTQYGPQGGAGARGRGSGR
ncbi:hypothetical protein M877_19725 [Streptomyces niveus NCIMB 11891]|nr:hypothetical protein M877_19725 [Streptomyces niveus NCIMB 11891]